ncbi:MAG: hypothetical protein ACR2PL_19390 [Dehalococcoidia bacterium]
MRERQSPTNSVNLAREEIQHAQGVVAELQAAVARLSAAQQARRCPPPLALAVQPISDSQSVRILSSL